MNDDDASAMLAELPQLVRRDTDAELKPGEVEVPTLPLPPPRDRDELDRFLMAVACTPSGQSQLISDTIADFDDPGAVADLAHQAMFELPSRDIGRHLTLLSLIGGLRHETSIEPLERFIWLEDGQVYDTNHEELDARHGEGDEAASTFPYSGLLQARAAEMLVWATAGSYLDGVRRVVAGHPSPAVRVAVIDAHLYASDDSPDAVAELGRLVRDEDRWAVGLPRRFDGQDTDAFDAAAALHQAQFGTEPQLPERGAGNDSPEGR